MEIKENVDISNYSTLKIGGQFRYFIEVNSIEELTQTYAIAQKNGKYKNIPIFILGGGSNIVFSDGIINVLAIKMKILGFEIVKEDKDFIEIKIGAGENWDKIVEKTIEMNLAGLESLSAIPGTVGATPVQNVGAYGAEVSDTIVSVEVFDTQDQKIKNLSNEDCKFGYRDSIFKNEAKGRYIITNVIFRLKKIDTNIDILKKREEIISVRWSKLPKPNEIPNVGSFFKNPIVSKEEFITCTSRTGTSNKIPHFDMGNDMIKIPAGWLIENAGLKGRSFGNISVYEKNALVLINNGNATKDDLMKVKNEIVKVVQDKFGITLEQEPEMV